MKKVFNLIAGAGLALSLASCSANPGVSDRNNYPSNGTVYRAGDGNVYNRGEVYRDRNGNVYQNGRVIRRGDVYGRPGVITRGNQSTVYYPNRNARNLPPGQAKKIYGGSAKDYAKGQQKKKYKQYKYNDNGYKYNDKKYKKGNKKYNH